MFFRRAIRQDSPVYLRYWGSHFKTPRHAADTAAEFAPFVKRGWACHLVLSRLPESEHWLEDLRHLGVALHLEDRPKGKYDLHCIRRVAQMCRKLSPDVFMCENIHMSPLLGAVIAKVPVRVWMKHAMNSAFELCRPLKWTARIALSTRLSCWCATRVMAVSTPVKKELVGLGIKSGKILVRHNPRRLGTPATSGRRETIRRERGYSELDVVTVSVGNASPVKGWDLLIRAFSPVAKADSRARLLLLGAIQPPGKEPFSDKLRKLVAAEGLSDRVVFAGHTHDIAGHLAAADLFAMPSRSEGFSQALVEALEAGLPCIATRVGIAEEAICPGSNGLLVDRANVEDLAGALAALTSDDYRRKEFAAATRVPPSIPTLSEYAEGLAKDFEALRGGRSVPAGSDFSGERQATATNVTGRS